MSLYRENSLDPVQIPHWRWNIFLKYVLKALTPFNPSSYHIPKNFLYKEEKYGSKLHTNKALISTWACKTKKIRQARAACVEAGKFASVLNLVLRPSDSYELPFFGADFVTLPSGHLLALDLQPVLKTDFYHTQFVWERLLPLHDFWQKKLPSGGDIPLEAKKYFSPGFLWTRLPLGAESDEIISDVIFAAFQDYLNLYLDFVKVSEEVSCKRSLQLLEGQKSYMRYRAKNDPARGMLTRFYGKEWTEQYIHKVLFDL